MSARANTITVVREKETRIDDLDSILDSIKMIKGVATADANVTNIGDYWAVEKARWELTNKMWEGIYPKIEK